MQRGNSRHGGPGITLLSAFRVALTFLVLPFTYPTIANATEFGSESIPFTQSGSTRPLLAIPLQETNIQIAAERWGVSEEDWQRYQTLMRGEAGMHFAHLEPAAVLGIYARDDLERQRFAEIWTQQEHERVSKILNFQRAWQDANKKLYADSPMFDREGIRTLLTKVAKLSNKGITSLSANERLALFVSPDCEPCDALTDRLVKRKTPMDIYILGASDDDAIRQWAMDRTMPPELISSRHITLNHDNGTLRWVSGAANVSVPQAYAQRPEGWTPLDVSAK